MRVLCIGDVIGSIGCEFLRKTLPQFKKLKGIDFVICNGENSTDGNGIVPASAQHLFTSGVDVITLGNHAFRRKFTSISTKKKILLDRIISRRHQPPAGDTAPLIWAEQA